MEKGPTEPLRRNGLQEVEGFDLSLVDPVGENLLRIGRPARAFVHGSGVGDLDRRASGDGDDVDVGGLRIRGEIDRAHGEGYRLAVG